jgi:uncharacterized membrane protein
MDKNKVKVMILEIIQAIVGLVLVLFLPGFVATYVIFPGKKEIDEIERFALSFGLSIAIVPLMVFALSIAGIPINLVNIVLEVAILIVILLAVYFYQQPKEFKRWKKILRNLPEETGNFIKKVTKTKAKPKPKKK